MHANVLCSAVLQPNAEHSFAVYEFVYFGHSDSPYESTVCSPSVQNKCSSQLTVRRVLHNSVLVR